LTEIAQVERLPAGYLEQLVMPLRKAGLVDGARGPRGGYELAVPPERVTVGAVVRALEGAVAPVECLDLDYVPGTCEREKVCLSKTVWQRVKDSVDQVLDSMTLADLCASPSDAFIPLGAIGHHDRGDPCAAGTSVVGATEAKGQIP
jgi:Rrf2 family protein